MTQKTVKLIYNRCTGEPYCIAADSQSVEKIIKLAFKDDFYYASDLGVKKLNYFDSNTVKELTNFK